MHDHGPGGREDPGWMEMEDGWRREAAGSIEPPSNGSMTDGQTNWIKIIPSSHHPPGR